MNRSDPNYEMYIHDMMWTKMTVGKWRQINYDREDIKEFISAITSFCHAWGQAEFNKDFTKFRRIKSFKQYREEYESIDNSLLAISAPRGETFYSKRIQYLTRPDKVLVEPIFDPSKPFQNKLI